MSYTDSQLSEQVSNQIRSRAVGDQEPSPPLLPSPPQQQLTIRTDNFVAESSATELANQVSAQIRNRATRDRLPPSLSPSQQRSLAAADPIFADDGVGQSPPSDTDSDDESELAETEYAESFGVLLFSVLAVVFSIFVIGIDQDDAFERSLYLFAASAFVISAISIIYNVCRVRPGNAEKTYSESRLLLKEVRRAVLEAERQKGEFIAGLDEIIRLDRCVRRMANSGVIKFGTSDWELWEKLRDRYYSLEQAIPTVDLNSQLSPERSEN